MIDQKSMTDTFFAAMGGISLHHLEDCERVRTAGLPKRQEPLLLRIMEPVGIVAMVAAVLAVLIVAPDFLKRKPMVSADTTETTRFPDEDKFDFSEVPEDIKIAFLQAYSSIVQLDRATREELEDAYLKQYGDSISFKTLRFKPGERMSTYCLGAFEDCTVIFFPTLLTVITEKCVAGSWFSEGSSFVLLGYHDGVFYPLEEAYEKGFITREEVAAAAECKRKIGRYNGLLSTLDLAEDALRMPEDAVKAKIEDAFRRSGIELPWMDLYDKRSFTSEHLRSYGEFDQCTVLVQVNPQGEEGAILIGDTVFQSRSQLTLWAYCKGSLYTLEEALKKGYLSSAGLAAARHREVERYVDAVTEDWSGFSSTYPSEEWIAKFRSEYIAYKGYDPTDYKGSALTRFYGSYGDTHFVMVLEANGSDEERTEWVAGYVFRYSKYCRGSEILVWVDGSFLTLKDAYEQDLITKDLVYKISKLHRANNYQIVPNVLKGE